MFRFPFLLFWAGAAAVLCAGCGRDNPEVVRLEKEIAPLREEVGAKTAALEKMREERRERRETGAVFVDLNRTLQATLDWTDGQPVVRGHLTNETDFPLSSVLLQVTREQNQSIVKEERIRVTFDQILEPKQKTAFTETASPAVWGFQPGWEDGIIRLRIVGGVVAGGRILDEDLRGLWELESRLARAEEELLELRRSMGRLITRRDALLRD